LILSEFGEGFDFSLVFFSDGFLDSVLGEIKNNPNIETHHIEIDINLKNFGTKGTIDSDNNPSLSAGKFSGFK
jgi:hypothetical protein